MASPINGDQLKWCGWLCVNSTVPILIIFSWVKKLKAVKIASTKPIIIIMKPTILILINYSVSDFTISFCH